MCVKIKQTFRRKKSCLISSVKYKLNFNAETLLDLFYKWWCFDLEAQNVHGFPELRAVFSTEASLHFVVLSPVVVYNESPSMKITEIFHRSPLSCTGPNWLSDRSTQARLTGTFCAQSSGKSGIVPGPSGTVAFVSWHLICRLNRYHLTSGCTKLSEGCAHFFSEKWHHLFLAWLPVSPAFTAVGPPSSLGFLWKTAVNKVDVGPSFVYENLQ